VCGIVLYANDQLPTLPSLHTVASQISKLRNHFLDSVELKKPKKLKSAKICVRFCVGLGGVVRDNQASQVRCMQVRNFFFFFFFFFFFGPVLWLCVKEGTLRAIFDQYFATQKLSGIASS
jgi:hypothetical protein